MSMFDVALEEGVESSSPECRVSVTHTAKMALVSPSKVSRMSLNVVSTELLEWKTECAIEWRAT